MLDACLICSSDSLINLAHEKRERWRQHTHVCAQNKWNNSHKRNRIKIIWLYLWMGAEWKRRKKHTHTHNRLAILMYATHADHDINFRFPAVTCGKRMNVLCDAYILVHHNNHWKKNQNSTSTHLRCSIFVSSSAARSNQRPISHFVLIYEYHFTSFLQFKCYSN